MKVATYQSGVDVLGFPIYVEHYIYSGEQKTNKIPKKKNWCTVINKIIKQH